MLKTPFSLICFLTIMLLPFMAEAQRIDTTRVSIHMNDGSFKELIVQIEKQTDFRFLANAEDIEKELHININVSNQPLSKLLDQVLAGRKLQYTQTGSNIILKRTTVANPGRGSLSQEEKFSVHGTIQSGKTGENIIGASIHIDGGSIGTVTNDYGFFSLTLPKGNYSLSVSAVSMQSKTVSISLHSDLQLDLLLEEAVNEMENVTVKASETGRSISSPQMSMEKLNVRDLNNMPVLFGERDIMKAIQLLPGVKSVGEGGSGFYVRGGAADQNLILLDEAPVYNATHLLGFFSTFNSDAIKNVTLYKGGMPAQYGGRLSSVVDIKMNNGNNRDFDVSGGIGLIASRLNIEGPLQKERSSFLVSARRTYVDMFLKLLGDSDLRKTSLYFYDLNTKVNFILDENNRIYLSGYFGRDVLGQEKLAGINWGNATGTLRWNHIFNKKLFSNTSLIFSNYDYRININTQSTDYGILSRIRDWNLKEELQWYADYANTVTFGFNTIYHTIKPGEISVTGNTGSSSQGFQDRYSWENVVYGNNTWKISDKYSLAYGLRLNAFSILGEADYYTLDQSGRVVDTTHYNSGEIVKTYLNAEPRLAFSYQLNTISSVKASYTRNTQNLHLVSNSTSTSPTDKWIASTNIIRPEIADQFAVGYYRDIKQAKYELTVEAYYKSMQNQIDYRNGAQIFTNQPIETQLLFGKGRAYGLEWLLRKRVGKLSGWISYTLSKTERRIQGINSDNWYNARQDRTHDVAIVAMLQLNSKWTLSANWIYYTGDAVTFPAGKYTVDNQVYFYYTERNGYRMPDYHRLDIGATRQLRKRKNFSSELNFSIFNAYGRANAYQIDFRQSEENPEKTEAVRTALFTFVPSISYNFKF